MAYQVSDEHGATWVVGKGDPAYPLVQTLRKADYTWIILPRETILSGKLANQWHAPDDEQARLRVFECQEVLRDSTIN